MTRRQLLLGMPAVLQKRPQRVIVLMVDGLGADYIAASRMPVLASWRKSGIAKTVADVMPSVTNANNASHLLRHVAGGTWHHGQFLPRRRLPGGKTYMESADLVLRTDAV